MDNTEVVRVEIAKLELRAGDTLVVKSDREITREQAQNMRTHMQRFVGEDVEVLVLGAGMSIEVLRKEAPTACD